MMHLVCHITQPLKFWRHVLIFFGLLPPNKTWLWKQPHLLSRWELFHCPSLIIEPFVGGVIGSPFGLSSRLNVSHHAHAVKYFWFDALPSRGMRLLERVNTRGIHSATVSATRVLERYSWLRRMTGRLHTNHSWTMQVSQQNTSVKFQDWSI